MRKLNNSLKEKQYFAIFFSEERVRTFSSTIFIAQNNNNKHLNHFSDQYASDRSEAPSTTGSSTYTLSSSLSLLFGVSGSGPESAIATRA